MVIGSALLGQLPVLIMLYATASSYDPQYIRCHLSVDWLAPFIIMPHIFSKFSSPRLLVASYFLGLSLFILLNQVSSCFIDLPKVFYIYAKMISNFVYRLQILTTEVEFYSWIYYKLV